ncbi:MAG TPA: DNA translocase FtsK [Thermoanaerobaculia bacterium]|nr:DNA translocase FtsK [Thermoanaerobaculia bacterium]
MTVARTEARPRHSPKPRRVPRLPDRKGQEVVGVVLLAGGLLLLASFLSYYPRDPSAFHVAPDGRVRNLIGPVGAELAAAAFALFGLASMVLPAVLLGAAVRRLWPKGSQPVVGRAFGLGLVVLVSPLLCQLVLRSVSFRGETIDAGGAVGFHLLRLLEGRLGFLGALLVVLGLLGAGLALVVQTSLEQSLTVQAHRLSALGQGLRLRWERRRERRHRDRSRQQVITKYLERAKQRKEQEPGVAGRAARIEPHAGAALDLADLPLRVTERVGDAGFAIRRVSTEERLAAEPAAVAVSEPAERGGSSALSTTPQRRARAAVGIASVAEAPDQRDLGFPKDGNRHVLPPINLLQLEEGRQHIVEDELVRLGERIRTRCAEFGVEGTVEAITPGPVITVFEFQPAPGIKVSQIVNLQDDLALALKAEAIRIDRIPGRSTLGIEVPNDKRSVIRLGPLLLDDTFRKSSSPLTLALGRTLHGRPYTFDLAAMPHLLVAGATGAGKSVGLQSMITSILFKANRDEVKFIFIDPKRIELGVYANIPHLKAEVVVEPKKAANALRWAVAEMERRYRLLAEVHVRSIDYYNRAIQDPEVQKRLSLQADDEMPLLAREDLQPLPYYVVIIDELADLMMVSSSEVEQSIARLAQMARAVGIHLIVATQRPSVDVLTGTIKANFPCRLAFATATRHDSRTILDGIGAEKLLGKGDMLFMPPGSSRPIRLHGAYVSEQETAALVRWLKKQGPPELDPAVVEAPVDERGGSDGLGEADELFDEAARLVVAEKMGSASFLQRRMRVGFSRAARLIDMLEQEGILGPPQGSKPREVLVKADYFEEIDRAGDTV